MGQILDLHTLQNELTKEITKKELRKTCRLLSPYEANIIMTLPKWEEFENENLRPAN